EELLGPAVAPDHVYRDWVYRIVGSQSGEVVTYHLTVISPGAPPLPQTMTAVLTARSVTLGPPFGPGSGVVLTASTQQLYDLAARAHVKSWTGDYG
ncbi:MAG TPA: hypothetical protein VEJ44_07345, partial [Acidimicrobiales bacterium]|nr:hypothetical protein [Acidimicrobiales bacterium]